MEKVHNKSEWSYNPSTENVVVFFLLGENDSGKTSWANVFFGLIHPSKIAVLSKEKNFGASMISERTDLLFIDEWVYETMAPDQMKTILQGGYFSQAVKHEKPKMTKMNGGIYITCQRMPKFGNNDVMSQ